MENSTLSIIQLLVIGIFSILIFYVAKNPSKEKSVKKDGNTKKLNDLSPNEILKVVSDYSKILERINGIFVDENKLPRPKEEMFKILKLGYVILSNLSESEVLKIYPDVESKEHLLELLIANTASLACFSKGPTANNSSSLDEIIDGVTNSKNDYGNLLESSRKMIEERKYYTEQMRILEEDIKSKKK